MVLRFAIAAFLIVAVQGIDSAWAQQPSFGRPGTPTTSPYLNLVPGSNFSPAFNYYRSYRPEREFRQDAQQVHSSLRSLQREVEQRGVAKQKSASMLGTTGHPTSFQNLGNYFSTRPVISR